MTTAKSTGRVSRKKQGVEVHMAVSDAARRTWEIETGFPFTRLTDLADTFYGVRDMAAIASGSFQTLGMLLVPCSMKTLAGIVTGYTDNFLLRAADVYLKESRKVVLCPRETPLGKPHLRNLCAMECVHASFGEGRCQIYGAAVFCGEDIQLSFTPVSKFLRQSK